MEEAKTYDTRNVKKSLNQEGKENLKPFYLTMCVHATTKVFDEEKGKHVRG